MCALQYLTFDACFIHTSFKVLSIILLCKYITCPCSCKSTRACAPSAPHRARHVDPRASKAPTMQSADRGPTAF